MCGIATVKGLNPGNSQSSSSSAPELLVPLNLLKLKMKGRAEKRAREGETPGHNRRILE